jgi:c-di-GMP-binding flagellar brake protein YcgR
MGQERRRFFRIDDTLGVAYRKLTEEELKNYVGDQLRPVDALSLIASYDTKIANLTGQLRGRDSLVADILEALNAKLNTVIDQLDLENELVQRVAHKVQEVNICACGMGLFIDEEVPPGETIALDLLLKPSQLHLLCYATIVASSPAEEEGFYFTRMDFINMTSHDQEVLIQHIVKRQGLQLREQRETNIEVDDDQLD